MVNENKVQNYKENIKHNDGKQKTILQNKLIIGKKLDRLVTATEFAYCEKMHSDKSNKNLKFDDNTVFNSEIVLFRYSIV